MRKNNCEVVRRELDELQLDDVCSSAAIEHLRECSSCREFHQKQTKLRQIVGSLGTIAAPADFDFRLRARLANDSSSAAFHLKSVYWPFARRSFAVAALLIVFATGIVLVRNVVNRQTGVEETATTQPPVNQQPAKPVESPVETKETNGPETLSAAAPESSPQKIKNGRPAQAGSRTKRAMTAVDFSSERAPVINGFENSGAYAAFPIDASLQSLKVSLDDGRGNARIISVPTISFGSQRMLQGGNQFAPKNVW